MGILREILDTLKDISSIKTDTMLGKKSYSSISKRSLEGTLQFPTLVSKSLDIDTLQMITKALERQYASFVQVALSMSPVLDLTKDKDAAGYLKRFHQNSNVRMDASDIVNSSIEFLKENTSEASEDAFFLFATVCEGSTPKITAANKDQLIGIMESIRQDILNDKFVPKNTYLFANESVSTYHNTIVTEGKNRSNPETSPTKLDINLQVASVDPGGARSNKASAGGNGMNYQLPNEMLKNNDAKKANELIPTTMHVRTNLMANNINQGQMDFIVGVKATMHPITSNEMVSNMLNASRGNNKFFNYIRWTSGEITFFKDFLFNIKEIQDDVMDRSAGSSPWWIALKRRRVLAKVKSNLMLPNRSLPNATIVMSMEEVEFIKSEYGFDLMSTSIVDKIMKEYFLLGFTVVDNSTQVVHFFFDGHQEFQSVSFSGLERENNSGVNVKDVMKIMQRN